MKNIIKIGTRKSKLALIQTDIVKDKIKQAFPELEVAVSYTHLTLPTN